ncbi:MAG: PAS domain S-box protein [Spirochaetota bacterium]
MEDEKKSKEQLLAEIKQLRKKISNKKLVEEQTAFFQEVIRSSNEAITGVDTKGLITTWSVGAEKMFGYSRAEALGQSIAILSPPETVAKQKKIIQTIANGGEVPAIETIRIHKNGTPINIQLKVSPIKDSQDRIIGISAISTDITEIKQAQSLLVQSAKIASLGIWNWNAITNHTVWSEEFYKIFRFNAKKITPNYKTFLALVYPEDLEYVKKQIANSLQNPQHIYDIEFRILRQDKEIRYVRS